jgi:DNA-binding response OmpR family regulator
MIAPTATACAAVHQLRQVIDKPFDKPLLHTVHGVGYRLAEGRDGV